MEKQKQVPGKYGWKNRGSRKRKYHGDNHTEEVVSTSSSTHKHIKARMKSFHISWR